MGNCGGARVSGIRVRGINRDVDGQVRDVVEIVELQQMDTRRSKLFTRLGGNFAGVSFVPPMKRQVEHDYGLTLNIIR